MSVDRDHKILLREAHLPNLEFGVQSEFHFRLVNAVIGLNGQLQCIIVVLQHGEVKIAERGIGNATFTVALGIARLGRNGDGVAVLVDQRELVLDRIGRIGVIGGADKIKETFADDVAIGNIGDLGDRGHLYHINFKRKRRSLTVDCQSDRVFPVLIVGGIDVAGDSGSCSLNIRNLAWAIKGENPFLSICESVTDIRSNGNIRRPGLGEIRRDAEIADRAGQREIEQSTLTLVSGGIIGFRLEGVCAVTKHHCIENVVEFRQFGDSCGDGSVKEQIDFGNTNIVRCRNCDIKSAAFRIHSASCGNDIIAVFGNHLDSRCLKIGNRIVQGVSFGNRAGIPRLIGSGHGNEQSTVGVERRADCSQKILDGDIAGFINLDRFCHTDALSSNRDFFKVDVVCSTAQSEGFVVGDSSCRIGRSNCNGRLSAVDLEYSGNRIGIDAVGNGGQPIAVCSVRNILIKDNIDRRSCFLFGQDYSSGRICDLPFPRGAFGHIGFKRKTVFDVIPVGADEFIAGNDVENCGLVVNLCDRTGNCDDCGDRSHGVEFRSFGIPVIQCGDRRQISKSSLSGRIDGNIQPVRHGFCNSVIGTGGAIQQQIGSLECDIFHFAAAGVKVELAGTGGNVTFHIGKIFCSIQRDRTFRYCHFDIRINRIADVINHCSRKIKQRNDFIYVIRGNGIDFLIEIIRLLDDTGGGRRFPGERLCKNVVLKRCSSQCGSKRELFFPCNLFLIDRHRNVVIVDDIELETVN